VCGFQMVSALLPRKITLVSIFFGEEFAKR
jgi:hypothetical protein